jgi:PKD repeat protein
MKITIFLINFLVVFAFSQFSLSANSGLISCEIKGEVEVCTSSEKVYVYTLDAPVMSGQTVAWNVTGGVVKLQNNTRIQVIWESPGTKIITANVTPSGYTCSLEISVTQSPEEPKILYENNKISCKNIPESSILYYCTGDEIKLSTLENTSYDYKWYFNGQLIGQDYQITFTHSTPGTYPVELKVNNAACESSSELELTIVERPELVQFEAIDFPGQNVIDICLDQALRFEADPNIDESVVTLKWAVESNGIEIYREFIPAEISTQFIYLFNTPGSYIVSLTPFNCNSCPSTSSYEITVNVDSGEKLEIICPSVICEGSQEEYSTTAICNNYIWQVIGGTLVSGQGTPSITVDWDQVGMNRGAVILEVEDCNPSMQCTEKTIVDVPIFPTQGSIIGEKHICAQYDVNNNSSLSFKSTIINIPGTIYEWSSMIISGVGNLNANSPNNLETYTIDLTSFIGSIEIKLKASHPIAGCELTLVDTIYVNDLDISGVNVICFGEDYKIDILNNTPAVESMHINVFESGKQTIIFSETYLNPLEIEIPSSNLEGGKTYTVEYTVERGQEICIGNLCFTVFEEIPPVSQINGEANACLNSEYTYSIDPSELMAGEKFLWQVTGGTIIDESPNSITVLWNTLPGAISVEKEKSKLIQECQKSYLSFINVTCTSTSTILNILNQTSVGLEISGPTEVCSGMMSLFTANHISASNYNWTITPADVGNIVMQSGSEIMVVWNNVLVETIVNVSLTNVEICGVLESAVHQVTVSPGIEVELDVPDICENEELIVTALLTDPTSKNYNWYLDGILIAETEVNTYNFGFLESGKHSVSVSVADNQGCSGYAHAIFEVKLIPEFRFRILGEIPAIDPQNPSSPPFEVILTPDNRVLGWNTYQWQYSMDNFATYSNIAPPEGTNRDLTVDETDIGKQFRLLISNDICTYTTPYIPLEYPFIREPYDTCVIPTVAITHFSEHEDCRTFDFFGTVVPSTYPPLQEVRWGVSDPFSLPTTFVTTPNPSNGDVELKEVTFSNAGYKTIALNAELDTPYCTPWTNFLILPVELLPKFEHTIDPCLNENGNYTFFFEGTTEWINDDNLPVSTPSYYWLYDGLRISGNLLELEFTPGQERIICLENSLLDPSFSGGSSNQGLTCKVCKTVIAPDAQQIEIMPNVSKICDNEEPITFSSLGINESEILKYNWNLVGEGLDISRSTIDFTLTLDPGEYQVTLDVITLKGCTINSDTLDIEIIENTLTGEILQNYDDCRTSAELFFNPDPTGILELEWLNSGINSNPIVASRSGVYTAEVRDTFGCKLQATTEVMLDVEIGRIIGNSSFCDNQSFMIFQLDDLPDGFSYREYTDQPSVGIELHGTQIFLTNFNHLENVTIFIDYILDMDTCATISKTIHRVTTPQLVIDRFTICDPVTVELSSNLSPIRWQINSNVILHDNPIKLNKSSTVNASHLSIDNCGVAETININVFSFNSYLNGCYILDCNNPLPYILPSPDRSTIVEEFEWRRYDKDNPAQLIEVVASGVNQKVPDLVLDPNKIGLYKLFVKYDVGDGTICEVEDGSFCLEDALNCCPTPQVTFNLVDEGITCISKKNGYSTYRIIGKVQISNEGLIFCNAIDFEGINTEFYETNHGRPNDTTANIDAYFQVPDTESDVSFKIILCNPDGTLSECEINLEVPLPSCTGTEECYMFLNYHDCFTYPDTNTLFIKVFVPENAYPGCDPSNYSLRFLMNGMNHGSISIPGDQTGWHDFTYSIALGDEDCVTVVLTSSCGDLCEKTLCHFICPAVGFGDYNPENGNPGYVSQILLTDTIGGVRQFDWDVTLDSWFTIDSLIVHSGSDSVSNLQFSANTAAGKIHSSQQGEVSFEVEFFGKDGFGNEKSFNVGMCSAGSTSDPGGSSDFSTNSGSTWKNESLELLGFELYPNPADRNLNVVLEKHLGLKGGTIEFITLTGQTIKKVEIDEEQYKLLVSTDDIVPGIYQVKINGNNGQSLGVRTIVIMR